MEEFNNLFDEIDNEDGFLQINIRIKEEEQIDGYVKMVIGLLDGYSQGLARASCCVTEMKYADELVELGEKAESYGEKLTDMLLKYHENSSE